MFDYHVIFFAASARRRMLLATGIAGGLLVTLAGSAQAQFFGWWGTPPAYNVPRNAMIPPNQIYRLVVGRGYQISGRLERSGRVYLVEVIDLRGRPQRLVIDAYDGDILQGFVTAPPRPVASISPQLQSRADLDQRYTSNPASQNVAPRPARTSHSSPAIPGGGHATGDDARRSHAAKTQTAARETGAANEPAQSDRPARAEAVPPRAHRTARTEAAPPHPAADAGAAQPAVKISPPTKASAPQPPANPEKVTAAAAPAPQPAVKIEPAAAVAPPKPAAPPTAAQPKIDGPGYANGVPINPLD